MSTAKNAVFFDIDGTLWNERMEIPKSTAVSIRRLRERGNYAFICSGRSRGSIRSKELFAIGFDGVLAGCGTHVEYNGKIIYEYLLPLEKTKELLQVLKMYEMPVILEGPECLYAPMQAFAGDRYVAYLRSIMGEDLKDLSEFHEKSRINKMSAVCPPTAAEAIKKALGEKYKLIFHQSPVVEILDKGFSKAAGIRRICDYLKIDHANTYAFGDSSNDLEMLQYVQQGIVMGNGSADAKAAADYITAPVDEDGVQKGLAHFGLI